MLHHAILDQLLGAEAQLDLMIAILEMLQQVKCLLNVLYCNHLILLQLDLHLAYILEQLGEYFCQLVGYLLLAEYLCQFLVGQEDTLYTLVKV